MGDDLLLDADQFGVAEPSIVPEGEDRIALQLPGIDNPERAKQLLADGVPAAEAAAANLKQLDAEQPKS